MESSSCLTGRDRESVAVGLLQNTLTYSGVPLLCVGGKKKHTVGHLYYTDTSNKWTNKVFSLQGLKEMLLGKEKVFN